MKGWIELGQAKSAEVALMKCNEIEEYRSDLAPNSRTSH